MSFFYRCEFWLSQTKPRQEIIMAHSICMPIWQLQIHEIAVWSSPCRRYVPMKNDKILKDLPNLFGIADDILVVGYDVDGKDHEDTI